MSMEHTDKTMALTVEWRVVKNYLAEEEEAALRNFTAGYNSGKQRIREGVQNHFHGRGFNIPLVLEGTGESFLSTATRLPSESLVNRSRELGYVFGSLFGVIEYGIMGDAGAIFAKNIGPILEGLTALARVFKQLDPPVDLTPIRIAIGKNIKGNLNTEKKFALEAIIKILS